MRPRGGGARRTRARAIPPPERSGARPASFVLERLGVLRSPPYGDAVAHLPRDRIGELALVPERHLSYVPPIGPYVDVDRFTEVDDPLDGAEQGVFTGRDGPWLEQVHPFRPYRNEPVGGRFTTEHIHLSHETGHERRSRVLVDLR